ncbi:guanylate kinase [Longimicrobium sp.]|uniref:guanylate kinase n=1 Tax=Longimicrobium sp. TaxID=2029185 RepID=UPI002C3C9F44|nr:guanylate kinase [Longimicrobium sp.]HSU16611.1 guanylate kinase [Longimicrobium sp.]
MTGAEAPFPLVVSAPSGAGKSTLARLLRKRNPDVEFSISATTRAPRPGERDGREYHFVGRDEFLRMRDAGELIEWAPVHGNFYGTPLGNVRRAQARGQHLLLDIDVQGARQIRAALPEAVHVFVLPPTGAALVKRLSGRGTESADVLERRLRNAEDELRAAPEFDYVVVNDRLETAVTELEAVLRGRAGPPRVAAGLAGRIDRLCAEIERELGPDGPVERLRQGGMR